MGVINWQRIVFLQILATALVLTCQANARQLTQTPGTAEPNTGAPAEGDPQPPENKGKDESSPIWLYFIIPVISGIVGYVTNVIALRMTFFPVEFWGWKVWQPEGQPFGLFGWQGIVPAKASVMAGRLVDLFTSKLINVKDVFDRVDPELVRNKCEVGAKVISRRTVEEVVKSVIPAVWVALPQYVKDEVVLTVSKESAGFTFLMMERLKRRITDVLDLKGLVERLAEEKKGQVVEMFLEVGKKEYRFVECSGWWFGLMFGGIQAVVYYFCEEWWMLPAAGLFVGCLTNLAAIRLIFEPAEPKKILCFPPIQGVFLKRQQEAATKIAELSEGNFLRVHHFFQEIINGKHKDVFFQILEDVAEEYLGSSSTTIEKLAAPLILGPDGPQKVRQIVLRVVQQEIGNVLPAAYEVMEQNMDLKNTLERKMQALPPADFIGTLRPVFQEDEIKLIFVGGVLGMIVGFIQQFTLFQWF